MSEPLTPEQVPEQQDETEPQSNDRERGLELALLALVVVGVCAIGLPQTVQSLRDGSLDLAAVFYPLLVAAFAGLAWSRRTGG